MSTPGLERMQKLVHQLKSGEVFEFVADHKTKINLPEGRHTVISSWGVRFAGRPPSNPWSLACKDESGQMHYLLIPPTICVEL